ncbi:MAG: type-F conjugative transfer system pilin assembly protein TraF [Legionella sp.]|uniref:type-F conjugative transfer system pilin assembly protein TraF n=1 Tax=Legionella sp. TaxID=459 RepID=UPI0039E31701
MIKVFCFVLMLFSPWCFATEEPVGFLWYSVKKEHDQKEEKRVPTHQKGTPFKQLSFTQRDAVLRFYTMEALHKARHTKSVEDMRVFLSLQHYWLEESSRFKQVFQQTMLSYPEYDYSVTHPTSNIGAKITDEVRDNKRTEFISSLAPTHGVLFFYRGKSPYDVKQIPIISDFCKRFRLTLMPVSVDGTIAPELPSSRVDVGQANQMNVRYFPAILLANPTSKKVFPVAFGLTTQDVLMERFVDVATQFKGGVS